MPRLTLGQRSADRITRTLGSWPFIVCQSLGLALWIAFNATSDRAWDIYPFILLNLALSFQAAYTGPIVLMSQNRADTKRDEMLRQILKLVEHESEEMEMLTRGRQ